jgi:aspartate kinase
MSAAALWIRKADTTAVLSVRFPEMSLRGPRLLRRTTVSIKAEIEAGVRAPIVVGTHSRRDDWVAGDGDAGASASAVVRMRELDRARAAGEDLVAATLVLALSALGVGARSLSARDTGLEGSGQFGAAVLERLDVRRVAELLAGDCVPVLAGGHVARPDGETAMLGPGGADWTAVALAAALGGVACHFMADPGRPALRARSIHPEVLAKAEALGVPVVRRAFGPRTAGTPR